MKANEYWIVEIQMFPGDRSTKRIVQIYRIDKSGDVGFLLIGDESVYWRSQTEWFDPIRKIDV